MDKNSISDDKKTLAGYEVHRLPKGMQPVHRDYGLWIVQTGSHRAPTDGYLETQQRYFEYYVISHLHGGKGRLWLQSEQEQDIAPGQCVIVPPHVVNRYGGADGHYYEEDTICFIGPVADMLLKAGVIKAGVFELGQWRALLPVMNLARDPDRDAQINANMLLQKLLVEIHSDNRKRNNARNTGATMIDKLLQAIKDQIHRWWTVEEMAEFCGLSKDQFRRVFKRRTGMLPKTYVDKLKLQKGAELLMSSDSKVAEIAEKLDYQDCYHFSRRFKHVMGFSPRQYRQEFGTK